MAKVQTTATQTAEQKIKYRFVCENCGHETDWIDTKITASAAASYKGYVYSTDSRVQNNHQLNTKAFGNLATAIQNIEERLRKGKLIGGYFYNANALNAEKNNRGRAPVQKTG